MASKTELETRIEEELRTTGGVLVPVRASFLERLFVKKVPIGKLHPNPDDEFCSPRVGPNYGIISEYERKFRQNGTMRAHSYDERLQVEKTEPNGYMILNGHHRWAAALRVGFSRIPVNIINLTQELDIESVLKASRHDRRVTLDLDEVIFCAEGEPQEKPRFFLFNPLRNERVRLGIPALLHFLAKEGYDIWIYAAEYYSVDDLQSYLKRYAVPVDGIITGTGRKAGAGGRNRNTEELFASKYQETLHIDSRLVLRIHHETGKYEEYELGEDLTAWSGEVINIVKGLKRDE